MITTPTEAAEQLDLMAQTLTWASATLAPLDVQLETFLPIESVLPAAGEGIRELRSATLAFRLAADSLAASLTEFATKLRGEQP